MLYLKEITCLEFVIIYLNMGAYGSGRTAGFTASLITGGLLCLGILSLLTAATIVLSLIPLYTPNHAVEGYGERKYKYITLKNSYSKKETFRLSN